MAQRVQGTEDLYGGYMRAWQHMQRVAEEVFYPYGFDMIETPAIEQVATFVHGIGESTDVVRKEMFRVFSGALVESLLEKGSETGLKAKQRLALRPEGTAGVVRALVEHNLCPPGTTPTKLWYAGPMFRGERPQKGRLRQFHQIGAEWLGADDAACDAEVIIMLMTFFERLGFPRESLQLRINSMGDRTCRPHYRDQVRSFILDHADEMCADCLERASLNPMRAFDCKNAHCREVMAATPLMRDNLCEDCAAHYARVKAYLDEAHISYVEDPTLVRGLDYYTRTVFEVDVTDSGIGAIGGGGRYDGLVELEGGKPTPGLGFAVGFERIVLALEKLGCDLSGSEPACVYIAATPDVRDHVFALVLALREAGVRTEADYQGRSLKSQFKQADRLNANLCVVIGPDEVEAGTVTLRDMDTHEQTSVKVEDLVASVTGRLAE